jgi:hypothetical protein
MLKNEFSAGKRKLSEGMKMKNSDHIVIERPLEKVFLWMFQPQRIVQLVTWDPTKDIVDYGPMPSDLHLPQDFKFPPPSKLFEDPMYIEREAKKQRFLEQAETKIEIENLSTPTLQVGTTFQYRTAMRSRSNEYPEFPKFPAWKPMALGSICIKKSVAPMFFAFTVKRSASFENHYLSFQAQQESTIINYSSTRFKKTEFIFTIASIVAPKVLPSKDTMIAIGNVSMRRQLLPLKSQMEAEID